MTSLEVHLFTKLIFKFMFFVDAYVLVSFEGWKTLRDNQKLKFNQVFQND